MHGDPAHDSTALTTADGIRLAATLELPGSEPVAAGVVAHPHPLYGGDQWNPVVVAVAAGLRDAGVATMRFGFRGAGGSEGTHGGGPAERLDVAAVADHLATRFDGLPLVLAGYSFGADVALTVDHPRVAGWLAVAPPLRMFQPDEYVAGPDPRPVTLLVPEHDQFDPPDEAARRTAGWTSLTLTTVPMADHFMAGSSDDVRALARASVEAILAGPHA